MLLLFPNNEELLCLEANNGLSFGLFLLLGASVTVEGLGAAEDVASNTIELLLVVGGAKSFFISADSSSVEPVDVSSLESSGPVSLVDFSVTGLSEFNMVGTVSIVVWLLLLPEGKSPKFWPDSAVPLVTVATGLDGLRNGNLGLEVAL